MTHPAPSRRLLILGPLVFGMSACVESRAPSGDVPTFYRRIDEGAPLDEQAALSLVNAHRARNGAGPLALDPALGAQARRRAASVAETDTSTWGEVPKVTPAAAAQGGAVRRERVSAGYRTLAEAFSGWRDSPPHNAVLLERAGTRFGIAAVDRPGTKYRVYWAIIVE
ncbi:MAG: CAP domain-containing protein [Alsobacter sp.]|nr:CAP domain-containing protein [Burkholderiales bacterium]